MAVENRFNTATSKIKQEELIAVVLSQAPKEYRAVLTSEQRMKKGLGHDVTLDNLKEIMQEHYKLLNCDGEEKEVAVYSADKGKKNHKRNNNRRRNKKFTGTCNNCRQHYHKEKDCWALEKNAHKRPQWYKNQMRNLETGAIGVHGPPEIVLTSIDYYETDSDESKIGMSALLIRGDSDSSVESNSVYSMYNETSDDESKVTMPSLAE